MASLFIKSTKSRSLSLNFSFFPSLESSIFRAFLLSRRKTNHVERKILMFWDNVAGVYDLFADIFNKETHKALIAAVSSRITPYDAVLECACGTGLLTGRHRRALPDASRDRLFRQHAQAGEEEIRRAAKRHVPPGRHPHLDEPDGQFDVVIRRECHPPARRADTRPLPSSTASAAAAARSSSRPI